MVFKDLQLEITPVKNDATNEEEDHYENYFKTIYKKHQKTFVEFAAAREYRKSLKRTWEEAEELY